MNHSFPRKPRTLALAIALAGMSLPVFTPQALAQDTVEEVIVTGSFIRRTEGFQQASPITQINADDIAAAGTPNMGDIIHNLSINQGTTISANAFTGAQNIAQSLNLRGLGTTSTLTLYDGKRVVNDNVNILVPQIAIQRVDIVADGAAALYGSEAVAGVVNFVPIKSYDGFKFEVMNQNDDAGDYEDIQMATLMGTEFNGIDLVFSANWREHSRSIFQ